MKRTKIVAASTPSLKVKITIEIDGKRYHWMRDEMGDMAEDLASAVMRDLSSFKLGYFPLSKIKVR